MTVRAALAVATARLAAASATARLDAELLMAHALGITREALLLGGLNRPVPEAFEAALQRREAGEPVAYITGQRAFWTIELAVTPAVLIPRPDSETLIEAAVARLPANAALRFLDLGTGSGALLLAALDQWPAAWGVGVDRSPAALAVARGNAATLGLHDRAAFVQGDWAEALDGCFDCVLANPPYIADDAVLPRDVVAHEPASALFAGPDGLDDYRRILPQLPRLLAPDGLALLEIGSTQARDVIALARGLGLSAECVRDLAGLPRCVIIRLAAPP